MTASWKWLPAVRTHEVSMKLFRYSITLCLSFIAASTCPAQNDVAILLRRVPESTDALLIVRLQALLQSPRGQREQWSQKYQSGYLNGAVQIPPTVKTMLMACDFEPDESKPSLTIGVALMTSKKRISMQDLAAREKGQIETVANQPVALTPRGSYFVELAPGFVGAMTPPNRKELARWVRFAMTDRDPVVSPYLRNAVSSGRGAPIQLAVDLKDIVDPKAVRLWLKNSKKLQRSQGNFDALFELIEGLKGIRFTARVQDTTTGEIYLDFSKAVGDRSDYLKELFLESLDEMGAALDDFRNAEIRTEAEGKTLVLKAELADATLREIMSLIEMPSIPVTAEETQPPSPGSKADLAATTRYYDEVQQLLGDLAKKNKKAEDYNKTGLWHETYAKKISQLPRQGVDEEMLQYGSTVSTCLWALTNSLHGVPLKVDLLQSQKYIYAYQPPTIFIGNRRGSFFLGGAAPTYTDTNIPEITAQQQEAIAQGQGDRDQVWKSVDQEKYRIRRRMSEKYNTDFDRPKN
jgi:hypothetical protein